jgi:hypothetical protein
MRAARRTRSPGLDRDRIADLDAGPLARGGDREHLLLAAAHRDLDAGAQVAHEADLAAQMVLAVGLGRPNVNLLGPDRENHPRPIRDPLRRSRDADRPAVDQHHVAAAERARNEIADADEVGDEGVARAAVGVERRGDLLHPAMVHHDHDVGHGHRLALVVGDHDGRDAEAALQQPELDLHGLAQLGVER